MVRTPRHTNENSSPPHDGTPQVHQVQKLTFPLLEVKTNQWVTFGHRISTCCVFTRGQQYSTIPRIQKLAQYKDNEHIISLWLSPLRTAPSGSRPRDVHLSFHVTIREKINLCKVCIYLFFTSCSATFLGSYTNGVISGLGPFQLLAHYC